MSWSHRLATLEPSPSFATITPIDRSPSNHSSRTSPFERHLAKYRSLPLLWLRTCGSTNQQQKHRTAAGHSGKDTNSFSFHPCGELKNPISSLVYIFFSPSSR